MYYYSQEKEQPKISMVVDLEKLLDCGFQKLCTATFGVNLTLGAFFLLKFEHILEVFKFY
jgi:hypothetical protein